jgi:hypothetical protein
LRRSGRLPLRTNWLIVGMSVSFHEKQTGF